MSRPYLLITGFGLTGLLLLALVLVNPNRFTSIDSGYYLQSAANLLAGRGYVIEEGGQWVWNGTFPIGYSALIAVLSGLTGCSALVASKLVNYGAVGFSGYLWTRRLGSGKAIWVLSIWWLGGFLKIMAYTWSETLFLVLLAEWVWQFNRFLTNPTPHRTIALFLIGYSLFLVRYIGGYVFGLTGLLAVINWLIPGAHRARSSTHKALVNSKLIIISIAGISGVSFYFWMNNHFSDSFFGGDRFVPTESAETLAIRFGQSLLNECLLIRDFIPNESNGLAWFGLGCQLVLIGVSVRQLRHNGLTKNSLPALTPLSRLFLVMGVFYVLILFGLRTVSPFDGPNLRLMAPFTFCLLTAGLLWISDFSVHWQRLIRPYWFLLLLFSWLQLLPQINFGRKIEQVREILFLTR